MPLSTELPLLRCRALVLCVEAQLVLRLSSAIIVKSQSSKPRNSVRASLSLSYPTDIGPEYLRWYTTHNGLPWHVSRHDCAGCYNCAKANSDTFHYDSILANPDVGFKDYVSGRIDRSTGIHIHNRVVVVRTCVNAG